jgi:hypothetical protein
MPFDAVIAGKMWEKGVIPDMEPATLYSKNSDGNFTQYKVFRVKRRPVDATEQSFRGASLAVATLIVEVWKEALAGAQPSAAPAPKVADYWSFADGTTYNIIRVGTNTGLNGQRINTNCEKRV